MPTYQARTGRLLSATTTPAGAAAESTVFAYDADGKVTSVSVRGSVIATPSYDEVAQLVSVAYAGGGSLASVSRDAAGRGVGQSWAFPQGTGVSESAVRSQSGRIVQHTITQGASSYASAYSYDNAGRLVGASIPGHQLTYGYAANGGCGPNTAAVASGNRTSVTDVWTAPGQAARTTTTTACYDWADRLRSASVSGAVPGAHQVADGLTSAEIVYDARGNTTRLADATLRYDAANAHVGVGRADGSTVAVVRDAVGRIAARTVDPAGAAPAVTTRYLYAGDGDEPFAQLEGSALTRNVELPGGATVTLTGAGAETVRQWQYPSMLGHTVTTGDGTQGSPVQLYDPFGQPLEAGTYALGTIAGDDTGTTAGRTGWHQGAQRLAETAGSFSIIEMGARLYVPSLGRFLQVDPVEGGVDNDYTWPTDPIGKSDTDGRADWRGIVGGAANVLSFGSLIPGPIGMLATALAVAGHAVTGNWAAAAATAIGFIPGAAIAARVTQMSNVAGNAARQIVGVQAASRLIGTNSRLVGRNSWWGRNVARGPVRLGWSKAAGRGTPAAWRLGVRGSHNHVFQQVSNWRWNGQGIISARGKNFF